MSTKIQFKRGSGANVDPIVLSAGEPAFTVDTGKFYIGDGSGKILINPIDMPPGLDTGNFYTKVQVNDYGQVVTLSNLSAQDIPDLAMSQITGLGTAAAADIGTSGGNIPALDASGKFPSSVMPSIAVNNTYVVDSVAAMLALPANVGDIAIRTDISESFILQAAPSSDPVNWVKLLTPMDSVSSVNGQTGSVLLAALDLQMTGYSQPLNYTPVAPADNISQAVGKLEKNFSRYAPLASPVLTGTPQGPTPPPGDNSPNLATTAFVANALTVIDGGTF